MSRPFTNSLWMILRKIRKESKYNWSFFKNVFLLIIYTTFLKNTWIPAHQSTTTKYHSDALNNSLIKAWTRLTLTDIYMQQLLWSVLFSFFHCLYQSSHWQQLKFYTSYGCTGNLVQMCSWMNQYIWYARPKGF